MRCTITSLHGGGASRRRAGFTLAEVLAALLFMAIVIPVAVEALRIASQAGQMAARRAVAIRIADRVLNELVVTGQWQRTPQEGSLFEAGFEYRWRVDNEPWELGVLRLVTVEVLYPVQGREYAVWLSTLADPAADALPATGLAGVSRTAGGAP